MLITFGTKLEYRPTGWSLGHCPACQQEGVVRLEEVIEVYSINGLIPLSRSPCGEIARCDLCDRRVDEVSDWSGVRLEEWHPVEGLSALLSKLGRPMPPGTGQQSPDARVHSL